MKHLMLKFNHGVEIGAYLAYEGHFQRTKDPGIKKIMEDELEHRETLKQILKFHNEQPSKIINGFFRIVGTTIKFLCKVSPIFLLDLVASSMEVFAVFNYGYLAIVYPDFSMMFTEMAKTELKHKEFFW